MYGRHAVREAIGSDGARVLAIADGGSEDFLARLEDGLASHGAHVLSLGRDEEPRADEAETIQRIAEARHAVGLGGMRDERARERLDHWLGEHPELDGLVWVGSQEEDGARWVLVLGAGQAPEPERLGAETVLAVR